MKKILTVWVFASLISTFSYAQNNSFEWGFHLGGSGQELLNSKILLDSDQNIIIAFNKNSTSFDVDPSGNVKNLKGKYFIAKYTPEKELVWVKEWGTWFEIDYDFKIAIDNNDNIYVTGNFVGEFDADPSEKKSMLKNETGISGFLVHLTDDGEFVQATQFGDGIGTFRATNIEVNDNLIVLSAYFNGTSKLSEEVSISTNAEYDPLLIAFNHELNYQWHLKGYGSDFEYINDFAFDNNNDIVVLGYFSKVIEIDSITIKGKGSSDAFLLKLDSKGNILWQKVIGNTNYENANALAIDKENNILITGLFHNHTDLDPSEVLRVSYSWGAFDYFILKLNTEGEYLWSKTFGTDKNENDLAESLVVDRYGNIYVDFTIPGENIILLDDTTSMYLPKGLNVLSFQFSPEGRYLNKYLINNVSLNTPSEFLPLIVRNCKVDRNGNIYKVGIFSGSFDANHSPDEENILVSNGSLDYFILKLKFCIPHYETFEISSVDEVFTAQGIRMNETGIYIDTFLKKDGCDSIQIYNFNKITNRENLDCIKVFPNPFNEKINLESLCGFNNLMVRLYTIDGRQIFEKYYDDPFLKNITIDDSDLKALSNSTYLLEFKSNQESKIEKLIKQR